MSSSALLLPSDGPGPRSVRAFGHFPQLRPCRLPPTQLRTQERRVPALQADPFHEADLNMQSSSFLGNTQLPSAPPLVPLDPDLNSWLRCEATFPGCLATYAGVEGLTVG